MRGPSLLTSFTLRPDDALLSRFGSVYGATPAARAVALAQALTSSPPWRVMASRARVVVRPEPSPTIGVVGRFGRADRPALEALQWQVHDSLARLRPVPYDEVEAACGALAEQLLLRVGPDRLRACRLIGVPRGGLIVAGLLSYSLGLTQEQLVADGPSDRETVLVDDCMLSGARTRRWLRGHSGPPVVLAHLHSHPALRSAVEDDPLVSACVAAADLHDYAPAQHSDRYQTWRDNWSQRSPDDFWTGHPDLVCYPWNEPDTVVWNDATAAADPGWHVVPPAWCLKNRSSSRPEELQLCASPHVPAPVLWAYLEDVVVLVDATRGASLELSGSGVDFWRELCATSDVRVAADALAARYEVEPATVRADLERFAGQLRDGGWWTPDAAASG